MDGVNYICWLFTAATIANVTLGQTVTGPDNTAKERGTTAQLDCSVTGATNPAFSWIDTDGSVIIFVNGGRFSTDDKYTNFEIEESLDTTPATSRMTITNIAIGDEGQYTCQVPGASNAPGPATVTVEVRSTLTVTLSTPQKEGEEITAQCDAIGGRPQETLTWYIDDVQQTDGVEVDNPANPTQGLTNTMSNLTFTPNRNQRNLRCQITGHTVAALNQEENTALNVQYPPIEGSLTVQITRSNTELTINCFIDASMQPNPPVNLYNISANDTLLESSSSSSTTYSPLPTFDTEFTCTASNGLGNISVSMTYEVAGTTTPPPTTATPTAPSSGDGDNDTGASTGTPDNTAAIAGGVVGGLAAVIAGVLIWYFCCKRGDCGGACTCCPDLECCPDGNCCLCCPCCDPEDPPKPVGGGSGGGKDNRVSGVATYNTSDPEKAPPVAKPRSTVQHDTNNPGGDMYAMVDKGGRGDRDYPDAGRNGRGQPADPQLTYADLDLSARKEVHIPKDEKEVVVYSSIVV